MTTSSSSVERPRVERPSNVPADRVQEVDLYALPGLENGFVEAWREIRQAGWPDLVWTPYNGGHWIATNGATIQEIYTDPTRFSSKVLFMPKEAGEKLDMMPITLDPPAHKPYRNVLDSVLNLSQVRKKEGMVRAIAAELIDNVVDRGACNFTNEYATVFPIKVFMTLAGLPMEDVPLLRKLAEQLTRPDGNSPEEKAASLDAANRGFFAYVEPLLLARKGGTGNDLITVVVNSQIEDRPLNSDEALRIVSLMLLGGLDTVVNFLSFLMLYLARHPDTVAELRGDHMKLMRSVEEMFRRFPVTQQGRMVAKDQHFHGVDLKGGDMVLLPTVLHSIDETLNPDPMKLDLNRRGLTHSTFGGGPHRCAGMHLARMEVIVTLEEWLKRIPEFNLREGTWPIFEAGIMAVVKDVQLVWNRQAQTAA